MSGKRQHFIPRFLQRGFASHTVNDEVFTWVYRKNAPAFNCNTKNVGVEGLFYSENNDTEVDDSITDLESEFSPLVEFLRTSKLGDTCTHGDDDTKLLATSKNLL